MMHALLGFMHAFRSSHSTTWLDGKNPQGVWYIQSGCMRLCSAYMISCVWCMHVWKRGSLPRLQYGVVSQLLNLLLNLIPLFPTIPGENMHIYIYILIILITDCIVICIECTYMHAYTCALCFLRTFHLKSSLHRGLEKDSALACACLCHVSICANVHRGVCVHLQKKIRVCRQICNISESWSCIFFVLRFWLPYTASICVCRKFKNIW